jgi:hypothetical protein
MDSNANTDARSSNDGDHDVGPQVIGANQAVDQIIKTSWTCRASLSQEHQMPRLQPHAEVVRSVDLHTVKSEATE